MKKLIALSLILSSFMASAPVHAMTTPMLTLNSIANIDTASVRDFPITPNGAGSGSNGLANQNPMPIAGTFSKLTVNFPTALTQGSYTITILKNGALSALTCTITTSSQACSDTNDAHSFSVLPGDVVSGRIVPSGTPTAQVAGYMGFLFDSVATGESFMLGTASSIPTTATTLYGAIGYSASGAATETSRSNVFPTNGTLDRMYIKTTNTPNGAGNSWVFTLRQNGSNTGITCTVNNTASTCNDTAHAVTLSPGDVIDLSITGVGTPRASVSANYGFRLTPTVDGESVMMANTGSAQTVSADRFMYTGGLSSNTATESTVGSIAPIAFTWKKLFVNFDTAPGVGKQRLIGSRVGGSSGSLTCTLADANTTCSDTSNATSVSSGNIINWITTPTNTPAGSTNIRAGAVMYIQPTTQRVVKVLTSGTSWTVPSGVTSVKAEVIGPGGHGITFNGTGSTGGGGGEYAAKYNISVTPGASVSYQIGLAGSVSSTWFSSTGTVLANGGANGVAVVSSTVLGGTGGVGDVTAKGGDAGAVASSGKSGGGGAGGPDGPGGNSGSYTTGTGATGGGGANGGSAGATHANTSVGTAGGNNRLGVGGGTAGSSTLAPGAGTGGGGGGGAATASSGGVSGAAGSQDGLWTDTVSGLVYGPGGGGGGSTSNSGAIGGDGGGYGSGGGGGRTRGLGSDGIIILTYDVPISSGALSPSKFRIFGGALNIKGGSTVFR